MRATPINAMIAVALALLPWPAMKGLDYSNRGCGDGLCGFFPGLLIIGGLATATLFFIVRSARRGEAAPVLRLIPLLLWAVMLALLTL